MSFFGTSKRPNPIWNFHEDQQKQIHETYKTNINVANHTTKSTIHLIIKWVTSRTEKRIERSKAEQPNLLTDRKSAVPSQTFVFLFVTNDRNEALILLCASRAIQFTTSFFICPSIFNKKFKSSQTEFAVLIRIQEYVRQCLIQILWHLWSHLTNEHVLEWQLKWIQIYWNVFRLVIRKWFKICKNYG